VGTLFESVLLLCESLSVIRSQIHKEHPNGEPGVFPEGIIGCMEDLKARLADAEAKLSHVKEYL
jgi:hypothetical protein